MARTIGPSNQARVAGFGSDRPCSVHIAVVDRTFYPSRRSRGRCTCDEQRALSDALRFEVRGFGVEVIVIEPGLIRTGFGDTAVGTLRSESDAEGPYGPFEDSVRRLTVESYEKGMLAALGGGPDDVARVVERAIRARPPRTRYAVTGSARLLLTLRRLLPDRFWDAFLRGTYPEPAARARSG